jgi:hypothetical protein
MAKEEQKVEKKKQGIIKRIFKWIALGILSILLIGTIVFAAPWKVTTLLVIILAACTILPKPYRKYFWLSVGIVIIALIIWVFLPDDVEGWRPYTFDKELAAIEAKYAIPDEENAAKIYNTLLASYDANDFEPNFADIDFSELVHSGPWGSEEYPEAADWLKGHQNTIDTLMEAAKKEKCHFQINADPMSISFTLDRLAPMRRWAYLLIYAGNNDRGEGRVNAAIEKYVSVQQIGRHLCQQPTVIDALVGIAIEALAIRQFDRFIITSDITEEHLRVVENSLSAIKQDWSSDLPKFTEYEKLFAKNLWGRFYGVNSKDKIRFNRNLLVSFITKREREDMGIKESDLYWHKKIIKASTILSWFFMPATPQDVSRIVDKSYNKYYTMTKPDYDWQKEAEKPSSMFRLNYSYLVEYTTSILEPAYHSIHDIYLRLDADKRCGQIIIALRRYKNKNGRWPESLEEITSAAPPEIFVDPINNSSFVYKLTEKDFTLYSKGKNNIDEQGRYDATHGVDLHNVKRFSVDEREDDRLIWPEKSRKDKEEKEDEQQQ